MKQFAGRVPGLLVQVVLDVARFKVLTMFNAVGKPRPLRCQYGERDQHVLEPASMHMGYQFYLMKSN